MESYETLIRRIQLLERRNDELESLSKQMLATLFEQEEELARKHNRIIELEIAKARTADIRNLLLTDDTTLLN